MSANEFAAYVEAINRSVMDVVCPPGTLALFALTSIVAPLGLVWLFWVLR